MTWMAPASLPDRLGRRFKIVRDSVLLAQAQNYDLKQF